MNSYSKGIDRKWLWLTAVGMVATVTFAIVEVVTYADYFLAGLGISATIMMIGAVRILMHIRLDHRDQHNDHRI